MQCPDPELIATYVDDLLDDAARAELEAHTDRCGACRRLLSRIAQIPATHASTAGAPAPEAADPEPGSTIGRYVILYVVGRGAMGIVAAAYDPELDRKVALKLLRGTDSQRLLLDEARNLAKVTHDNVVRIHDVGELGGRVFLAMEYVDGANLRDWLAHEPRTWREILAVFRAAGRGLIASHAAGLVHRDFKPGNVLIARTGDVRVTDFGLARAVGTRGALGTPAYMSPEQHAGDAADERSDQFSFCVALYEALYGQRPFAGATQTELADNIRAQRLVEASAATGRAAPGGVRDAIVKGLAVSPADRHPSLTVLLERLARAEARPRRRVIGAGAGVAVASLAGVWALWPAGATDELCAGGDARVAAHWNQTRRATLEQAFAATHVPYAGTSARSTVERLDRFRAAWTATYTEACRATHVYGTQSAERLDLQLDCLDGHLRGLDQLLGAFAAADATTVKNAVSATEQLPAPRVCRQASYLDAKVKPPVAEAQAAAVAEVRRALALAKVTFDVGNYAGAKRAAGAQVDAATKSGYGPAIVEAVLLLGQANAKLGEVTVAAKLLEDASLRALALGLDRAAAQAWVELVRVRGFDQANPTSAAEAEKLARALLERLPEELVLASALENSVGVTKWFASDLDGGDAHLGKAVELLARARGDQPSVEAAMVTVNRGIIAQTRSRYPESIELYERAVGMLAATVGTQHPLMSAALENYGSTLIDQHRLPEAIEKLRRALAITEAIPGADPTRIADTLTNLAGAQSLSGDHAGAVAGYERAIAIATQADPHYAMLPTMHYNIAEPLRQLGRDADALVHLEAALAEMEARHGRDHVSTASFLTGMGVTKLRLGRTAAARADLARALVLVERGGDDVKPEDRGEALFAMAKLLTAERREPARARALAEQALAELVAHAPDSPGKADVEAWLRTAGR